MPAHAEIDVRMKENYEHPYRIKLTKRIPVIIRIDGKAFHTFTRGFQRPYDIALVAAMQDTTKFLCENIMGCKVGYVQSDEISLLLTDYDTFTTQPYFDYNIQKLTSITASMATLEFNRAFTNRMVQAYIQNDQEGIEDAKKIFEHHKESQNKGAMFDSRCFNIPREEVTNYFFSRQLDAARNSIQMLGQAYFSHKELNNKSTSDIQDMVNEKFNINWNDLPTEFKRGSCCIKQEKLVTVEKSDGTAENCLRSEWIIDHDIPEFKGKGREYIEKYVNPDLTEGE